MSRTGRDVGVRMLVGVGASAGGLESLEAFFGALGGATGMAFMVVQHLPANHRSMMPELLGRVTAMPVRVAAEGDVLRADTVWLIPPGQFLSVSDGQLHLEPKPPPPALTLPIDRLFHSLADVAAAAGTEVAAVVLSGTGSDGSLGARAVRAAGGVVLVEDPSVARFDGMPRSVVDAGVADVVAPPAALARRLASVTAPPAGTERPGRALLRAGDAADPTTRIARLVGESTGVDFEHYKRPTIDRRIARRMALLNVATPEEYLQLLAADEAEREQLFNDLLIRVTSFRRDPEVWDVLRAEAISAMVADGRGEPLRMWVPACASGEEAYTLTMLVLDEMAAQGVHREVRVFATDVDQSALDLGARGRYTEVQMSGVSEAWREAHFSHADGSWTVRSHVRRCVLFAHHNAMRDAPFTRLDLVSCRNLLIYLDLDLQARALDAFHFGLREGGALLLGTSESVAAREDRFEVVDPNAHLFRAVGAHRSVSWLGWPRDRTLGSRDVSVVDIREGALPTGEQATLALVDAYAPPAVLVDSEGYVRHIYGDVSPYLTLPPGAIELNLLDMARPELRSALAAGLPRALRTGAVASFPTAVQAPETDPRSVIVSVLPLAGNEREPEAAVVAFSTPGENAVVDLRSEPLSVQLVELEAELRRARREQRVLVERLETFNEELQATNEEMVAANEELQATNEELQSVNEELFTVNAENLRRIHELEALHGDLDLLLKATDVGTLVVDDQLVIQRFTPTVSEFLPVLERDIGRPLGHLASSFGGPRFVEDVRAVIESGERREFSVETVAGQVLLRIIPYGSGGKGALLTFVDVSTVKRNYDMSRSVFDSMPANVAVLDREGVITMVNRGWERFALANGADAERVGVGANYLDVCHDVDGAADLRAGIMAVLAGESTGYSSVYPCQAPGGPEQWFLLECRQVGDREAMVVHVDISAQKHAEQLLLDLATHDPLTGVLNRRGIETELETVLRRCRRAGREACALMLDCDDFKRVNDLVGHAGGDAVLRTVARRITSTLRAGDIPARIGGDEFLVLLPEATVDAAAVAAERIRVAVASEPVAVSHDDLRLTVSVSVVRLDERINTLEQLIDESHDGLSASKRSGKNTVSTAGRTGARARRRADLVSILDGDDLAVAAQPIVATSDLGVLGVELLLRHVAEPFCSPTTIFRLAMEEGELARADERALGLCLAALPGLLVPGRRHVNLYPSTLLTLDGERVHGIFSGCSSVEHPLVVELSERQLLGEPAELVRSLDQLRGLGVTIALDDVGFGRTPVETLVAVEPSIVKLDVNVVRGVHESAANRERLRRLIRVAEALGASLVAEGVEQEAEREVLGDLGVDAFQGHLVAEAALVG